MDRNGPPVLDVAGACELLRDPAFERGLGAGDPFEMIGVLAERPFVVVDLDTPPGPRAISVPGLLPCVTVGITRRPVEGPGPPGAALDVLLAPAAAGDAARGSPAGPAAAVAPSPWVAVADVDAEVGRLADAVEANPIAAVTAAQVLRGGPSASIHHDLLVESLAYSTLQGGPEFAAWRASRPIKQRPPATAGPLSVERHGDELHITLRRPEVRNAYDARTRDALCEALGLALADPAIASVHLLGAGPDFCSGGDLDEFGSRPEPATAHVVRTSRSAARLLAALAPAVTAHLHGSCMGSGIELPAFAGTVLATPDTRIALPEVSLGLIPGAGGTASIPRRIGRHRTAWLVVGGARIGAETAHAWGLIDGWEHGTPHPANGRDP